MMNFDKLAFDISLLLDAEAAACVTNLQRAASKPCAVKPPCKPSDLTEDIRLHCTSYT